MMRSDAKKQEQDCFCDNISTITIEVILEIEKDIEPYDMMSLVFLLYEIPDTATQRLIVYQRVCGDSNMNLLYDWALNAQSRQNWRYEFLEALTICRLYNVIRKLGFDISKMKERFKPGNINISVYVNPMRKALYKLCEHMNANNLMRLKKSLSAFNIDTSEYETCELVFLKLMSHKFIILSQSNTKIKDTKSDNNIEKLLNIVENLPGLKKIAIEIRSITNSLNVESSMPYLQITSAPISSIKKNDQLKQNVEQKSDGTFSDVIQVLDELNKQDISVLKINADTKNIYKDAYPIKNSERTGICCIINQEEFHHSSDGIENDFKIPILDNRLGSTKDQLSLEKTMSSLNFKIKSCCNVGHREMFQFIKEVIQNDVNPDDSIFMLCILSHGIRGHVYAADSVKVKVEDIQNLLDSNNASHLQGMPKVLILQACQVDEHRNQPRLVPDGPPSNNFLRKSDFLIYWATAPEYEAYRDEEKGSIFIQSLCYIIGKKAKQEPVYDMFTKVTDTVSNICYKLKCAQVPIFESTLRKKLFLQIPK